jgi:hypothetical protein
MISLCVLAAMSTLSLAGEQITCSKPNPSLPVAKMNGPFTSLEEYCTKMVDSHLDGAEPDRTVECGDVFINGKTNARKLNKGFLAGQVFAIQGMDCHGQLALRTATGWYVLNDAIPCQSERSKDEYKVSVREFAMTKLGSYAAVRIAYVANISGREYEPSNYSETHEKAWIACSVGDSGIPSCTPTILQSVLTTDVSDGRRKRKSYKYSSKLKGSQLTIRRPAGIEETGADLPDGAYSIAFP